MKHATKLIAATMLTMTALPTVAFAQGTLDWDGKEAAGQYVSQVAQSQERALSQNEIDDLIRRAGQAGSDYEVRYVGGSQQAVETDLCCENVEEQVTERTEVQETTTYFDAVTSREVIQPVERTIVQPIERRLVRARTETVTEEPRYEEERLPVRIERDPTPQVVVNNIPQERTETRDEITETYFDAVTARTVIQPLERTTVVPVQRRITRPRVETTTAETRYEQRTAPVRVEREPVPAVVETFTPQITTNTRDEYTETYVDAVTQRDVVQPVIRTVIQPVERQILRGTTETVTADTQFVEERLAPRVERDGVPAITENVQQRLIEKTLYEVQDVYIDQVTRNVIQPVVITTIQPVEYQRVQGRNEVVTNAVQFETQTGQGRVEEQPIPAAAVNYIPQETVETRDEYSESYFEAVTQRDVIQPIVRTLIQPIEYQRVRGTTETVTAPTQYETVRASMIVLNVGGPCNCQ